jgi:hypothetical protein
MHGNVFRPVQRSPALSDQVSCLALSHQKLVDGSVESWLFPAEGFRPGSAACAMKQ